MADIRCSHCGKNNPDFLDVCQFCQSPLKSESMLHIGQKPTKKDTGELEGVLPDWLKNARQQSRDSAEEESAIPPVQPKAKKEEPVDLLAGLFQSDSSEEEDVPDWLTSINQNTKGKLSAPATPPPSAQSEPESDFFAQFNKSDSPSKSEPKRDLFSTPQSEPMQPSQDFGERDELSDWFSQASEQPADSFDLESQPAQVNSDWGIDDQLQFRAQESPAPKEEEDLSWLHNLENAAKKTDELRPPTPNWEQDFDTPSASSDQEDLSWLNNLGAVPGTEQLPAQPVQPSQPQEDLSWLDTLGGTPSVPASDSGQEDLDWLNKLGGTPMQQTPAQPAKPQEDLSWLDSFKQADEPAPSASMPQASSDDLSWLNDLGAASAEPTPMEPAKPQEDLSWLNAFGETPVSEPPAPAQPSSQEDLSWLDNLAGTPFEAAPSQQEKPQEDLEWLKAFGGTPESSPSATTPAASDLDWLNTLGLTPVQDTTASPSASQDDLSWFNNLQSGAPDPLSSAPFAEPAQDENAADLPPFSAFTPRKTAPLERSAEDTMPDWLKSATEGPSMPMGASELDQFREDYKVPPSSDDPFSWKSFTQEQEPTQEQPALTSFFPSQDQPEPSSVDQNVFSTGSPSSIPSAEDVNSLFSIEMPDWISQAEPTKQEDTAQPVGIHAEDGEALAPVDLPSWVQAMRPVDAVISESAPSMDDQPTEREGPLAGLKGLIPVMPVGSARRPKPISLKLQASDEQQASAAILEQILAGETAPRPLVSTSAYASQRTLRWALTALFILVLGAMVALRPQVFPPSAAVTFESTEILTRLQGLPAGGDVLVVVDYDAALAGELEAVSAPMLDQLALLRQPRLSFVSTSPNGPALVEKLMSNPTVRRNSDGLGGYIADQNYKNLGYLPGAESGVLSFIESPKSAFPAATVDLFSGYSAVIILTDHADSARVWIEQLQTVKQRDSALALQPLLVASSAQAGPMLQPYVASQQVNGLIAGLADASRFESQNASRPGIALSYLDAFGAGLLMAITLIVLGSLWSIFAGIRARRAEAAEG